MNPVYSDDVKRKVQPSNQSVSQLTKRLMFLKIYRGCIECQTTQLVYHYYIQSNQPFARDIPTLHVPSPSGHFTANGREENCIENNIAI